MTVLGVDEHADLDSGKRAETFRWREAADAADAVATALLEGWSVSDRDQDGAPVLRPCRPGDITVLLPARTSLPALEAALRDRDLPYRAENSSVVYTTTEIRHLMLALRAADDPTDELALVAALRTPLYGCSDVELYDWKAGGRGLVDLGDDAPEQFAEHPVGDAFDHLRSLAERSTWLTPADLLAALVDERRLLDAALDSPDSPRRLAPGPLRRSTRPAPGATPADTASGATSAGSTCWPARAAMPTRSCPNTTTTPCGS